jgi:hypothetical protein
VTNGVVSGIHLRQSTGRAVLNPRLNHWDAAHDAEQSRPRAPGLRLGEFSLRVV